MDGADAIQNGTISVSLKRVKPIAAQAKMSGVAIGAELTALALPADLMRRNAYRSLTITGFKTAFHCCSTTRHVICQRGNYCQGAPTLYYAMSATPVLFSKR